MADYITYNEHDANVVIESLRQQLADAQRDRLIWCDAADGLLKRVDNLELKVNLIYDQAEMDEAVKHEREACAKVCEEKHVNGNYKYDDRHECAEAIRNREK